MDTLREQLVATGLGTADKTRQLPVSRSSFLLTDPQAFETAVKLCANWIAATAASDLPSEAYEGGDFTFAAPDERAEASALNVADGEGRIWGARLSNRGDRISGRDWITDLFVEQRHGSLVRFGAQLVCKCKNDDPGFEHSRPRVVRNILETLAAEADGESLSNDFRRVQLGGVDPLVALLYNPQRRLPVLIASVDEAGGARSIWSACQHAFPAPRI